MFCALLAALVPVLLAASGTPRAHEAPHFRVTWYWVARETRPPPASASLQPIYGPACRTVIARTTPDFHARLSREGTGRLHDGRLVNFAERCACARPGHGGSRVCYTVLDARVFPWGRGARLRGRHLALHPFRSVAVDPAVVPLGSLLYVPALDGVALPDGRRWDGCLYAADTGRLIRGRRLDLFAGRAEWAAWLDARLGLTEVAVYDGESRCTRR